MHYSCRGCGKAWQSCREAYVSSKDWILKIIYSGVFLVCFFFVYLFFLFGFGVWVGEMNSPLSALMRKTQNQDFADQRHFSWLSLKGKLEQQDPETQAHRAAVTDARICK